MDIGDPFRYDDTWSPAAVASSSASKLQRLVWDLEKEQITSGKQKQKDEAQRRTFILQVAQPGLAALIDGSASRSLATSERLSHKEFLW
jgi:hypothetical protein